MMTIRVERFTTAAQLAQLACYRDEGLVSEGINQGAVVQYYQRTLEQAGDDLVVLAAKDGFQIRGYIAALVIDSPLFEIHLWGLVASAKTEEAGKALSAAFDDFAASRRIRRGVSYCRSEGALRAYARHGWHQGGYLIEKEFIPHPIPLPGGEGIGKPIQAEGE